MNPQDGLFPALLLVLCLFLWFMTRRHVEPVVKIKLTNERKQMLIADERGKEQF